MEIRASALRHGVEVADIEHALRRHIAQGDIVTRQSFGATGTIFIGPGRSGTLLEVISVDDPDVGEVVIHAMRLRPVNARRLLGGAS